jgi:hypothetical protein
MGRPFSATATGDGSEMTEQILPLGTPPDTASGSEPTGQSAVGQLAFTVATAEIATRSAQESSPSAAK